jgi:hypothetical protein
MSQFYPNGLGPHDGGIGIYWYSDEYTEPVLLREVGVLPLVFLPAARIMGGVMAGIVAEFTRYLAEEAAKRGVRTLLKVSASAAFGESKRATIDGDAGPKEAAIGGAVGAAAGLLLDYSADRIQQRIFAAIE